MDIREMLILLLLLVGQAPLHGQLLDVQAPPTTPVPCADKISTCHDFGQIVCTQATYAAWAMQNCRYFCRQCTDDELAKADSRTTPPPCRDQIGNDNCQAHFKEYGPDICANYKSWAESHCRYSCRLCKPEQLPIADSKTTTTSTSCRDKRDDCSRYGGRSLCLDFQPWARDNCPAFCGFCTAPSTTPRPCEDKLDNCQNYGQSVCTDPIYAPWVFDNCRYFCRQCTDEALANADSKTTTLPPPPCEDKLDNCARYGKDVCTSPTYRSWAQVNCRYFCRLCSDEELANADSKTTTLPPPPCVDKLHNCARYGQKVCTSYKPWAQDNCRYFCRFCTQDQLVVADSKTTTTTSTTTTTTTTTTEELAIADSKTTPPPCVDKLPDCASYPGPTVCTSDVYKAWAQVHCRYYCQFCTRSVPIGIVG